MTIRTALMYPDIVVIPAAGWKAGLIPSELPDGALDHRLPEILWPLADGNTLIERTVKQLNGLGVGRIVVGIGNPDNYPTDVYEDGIAHSRKHRCPGSGCPWTWGRVEQIKATGADVLLLDNPLAYSCQVSMYKLMKHIEDLEWDRVLGLPGDYLFKTDFLRSVIENTPWPSIHWIIPVHDMLFFDRVGHKTFVDFVEMRGNPCTLSGNGVWRRRELLQARGLPSRHVPDEEWKSYAPGQIGGRLPRERNIQFGEVGVDLLEWGAAQILTAEDPV